MMTTATYRMSSIQSTPPFSFSASRATLMMCLQALVLLDDESGLWRVTVADVLV